MTPNKHYEVLVAVEIEGTIREVGSIIELGEAIAQPFVEQGALKEHGEGSAPAPATPGEPTPGTPSGDAATPPADTQVDPTPVPGSPAPEEKAPPVGTPAPTAKVEEKAGWVGGHTVGGNEPNPHKGGGLRDSALAQKA